MIRGRAAYWRSICADPWGLARALEIRVLFGELPHGALEVWRPDRGVIVLHEALPESHHTWYLAHALGHMALHCGSQALIAAWGIGWEQKQESQADRFAAFSLAPSLKDLFRLPPEKRAYRIQLERICGPLAA